MKSILTSAIIGLTLVMLSGCAPEDAQDASATSVAGTEAVALEPAVESGRTDTVDEAAGSKLAGTAWRLVKIMSMDDSVYEPDEPANYTLKFNEDTSAAMLADCNHGTGSWTSKSAGQLVFGPIAATMALCPPGSLSERFLAQFQWVRSYVMKEGHLFLATMADGSIIEFEPASSAPLAATVLGKEIHTTDAGEMQQAVITPLFEQYAAEQGIKVQDAEIVALMEQMERGMRAEGLTEEDDLTPEETTEVRAMQREFARSILQQWKLNRSLYRKYGGRIISQQLGPEPLDAYREFLEEQQSTGAFTIHDPALEAEFWRYFKDDSIHSFIEAGSEEEARVFETPPWEQLDAAK